MSRTEGAWAISLCHLACGRDGSPSSHRNIIQICAQLAACGDCRPPEHSWLQSFIWNRVSVVVLMSMSLMTYGPYFDLAYVYESWMWSTLLMPRSQEDGLTRERDLDMHTNFWYVRIFGRIYYRFLSNLTTSLQYANTTETVPLRSLNDMLVRWS